MTVTTRRVSCKQMSKSSTPFLTRVCVALCVSACLFLVFVRLKSYLRSRLIESQWKNDLMAECQSVIFERGLQNVTVDELVHATNQKAMEGIPHKVKQTMIEVRKDYNRHKAMHIHHRMTANCTRHRRPHAHPLPPTESHRAVRERRCSFHSF